VTASFLSGLPRLWSICKMVSWPPGAVAEARAIVPNVNRISRALRSAGGPVVYIQNTFDEDAVRTWSTFSTTAAHPTAGSA